MTIGIKKKKKGNALLVNKRNMLSLNNIYFFCKKISKSTLPNTTLYLSKKKKKGTHTNTHAHTQPS